MRLQKKNKRKRYMQGLNDSKSKRRNMQKFQT